MGRRAYLPVLAIVALLAAGLGLWVAAPAFAAPKPIGLSADGVTYADDLPVPLFAGVLIVPGDSIIRSFYVQNRASDPGNLAVALQGVTGVDSAMISALSVHAVAGSSSGPTIAFPAANPCRSLVSGVGLAAGGVVRVDVELTLSASISGQVSQSSVGSFDLRLSLTSTDVTAPDGCVGGTTPSGSGGGGGGTTPPGEVDSTTIEGIADGDLPDSGSGLPDQSGSGTAVAAAVVLPNTGRFFQELFVCAWLVLAILGGILAWRWRRQDPEEIYR